MSLCSIWLPFSFTVLNQKATALQYQLKYRLFSQDTAFGAPLPSYSKRNPHTCFAGLFSTIASIFLAFSRFVYDRKVTAIHWQFSRASLWYTPPMLNKLHRYPTEPAQYLVFHQDSSVTFLAEKSRAHVGVKNRFGHKKNRFVILT